jgi:Arm DNA-binding domain
MAELVDAPASGAGDRKVVEVRVLFRAPFAIFRTSQKVYKNRRNPGELALGWFWIVPAVPGVPDIFAGLLQKPLEKGPHMALTETRLRALKVKDKPYKVADQRGLYIEVTPSGGKLWRFRYRIRQHGANDPQRPSHLLAI